MLHRFLEALSRAHQESERSIRENSDDIALRASEALATIERRLRHTDTATRLSLVGLVVSVALIAVSAVVPAIGDIGAGYFLRAGIFLAGVCLVSLLNPFQSSS
jgi:hypothetical protein